MGHGGARTRLPSPFRGGAGGRGRGRRTADSPSEPESVGPERGPTTPTPAPPPWGEGKDGLVLLGEFGRAHGLRGEVRLKSFAAEPNAIARYGPLVGGDGRQIVLQGVRLAGAAPDLLIARVEGVATREAAEALNRLTLSAPRERLGATDEDEFLLADLIGLAVEDSQGVAIGTILAVPNYGGGDLLEIASTQGGPSALLPFTKAFVPRVDLAAKRVVVDAPDLFEGESPLVEGT